MKINLIFILIFVSSFLQTNHAKTPNKNNVINSFQKIENLMKKHYTYLESNGLFEDPLGRTAYFFSTVKAIAPELLCNTSEYKYDILSILTSKTFKKNSYTNLDVQNLLCNISIKDYIEILYKVLELFEKDKIDFKILDTFIFQDITVSNEVAKNYHNSELSVFFNNLLKNKIIVDKITSQDKKYLEAIKNLKEGKYWEGLCPEKSEMSIKKINEVQPPILDTLKIDCK